MPTGNLVNMDSEQIFTDTFDRTSTDNNLGAWRWTDGRTKFTSNNAGPGSNNTLNMIHTQTHGSVEEQKIVQEYNGLLTFKSIPSAYARKITVIACVQGEFGDGNEGLALEGQREFASNWVSVAFIPGWPHSNTYETGDTIVDYFGNSRTIVADGGWVEFEIPVPDDIVKLRFAPKYLIHPQFPVWFEHDLAVRSFQWEWETERPAIPVDTLSPTLAPPTGTSDVELDVPFYELVAVAYTPTESGAPSLVELGSMQFSSLRYKRELNRFATYSARVEGIRIDPTIGTRLANYSKQTTECRIYRNGVLLVAGPIISLRFGTSGDITIVGRGSEFWLKYDYLLPTSNLLLQDDLSEIAREIINIKQSYAWGNVGIDYSTFASNSGIAGELALASHKGINCWEALSNLEDQGLTFYFTPNRELVCPVPGVDRRNEIVLNRNNVSHPTILINMAPNKVGSVAAISNSVSTGVETDDVLVETLGRKVVHQTVDKDFSDAIVGEIAEGFLAANVNPISQLGGNTLSLQGVSPISYGLNDIVSFEYDLGWNTFFGNYRARSIDVTVRGDGTEQIVTEEI